MLHTPSLRDLVRAGRAVERPADAAPGVASWRWPSAGGCACGGGCGGGCGDGCGWDPFFDRRGHMAENTLRWALLQRFTQAQASSFCSFVNPNGGHFMNPTPHGING